MIFRSCIRPLFGLPCVMWRRFKDKLAEPIDPGSLAMVRIFFGTVMALEAYSLLSPQPVSGMNLIELVYTGEHVKWNFPYPGFEWIRPWNYLWMVTVVVTLGASSLCVAAGIFYRFAIAGVFLSWTYIWMVDITRFNNHYYLMSLLAFLLIWMPADRCYSLDRRVRAWLAREPLTAPAPIPYWPVFLLQVQLLIVYFFGGVAKLNYQWLSTTLMHLMLSSPSLLEPFTPWLSHEAIVSMNKFLQSQFAAGLFSYGGLLFDLAIGPMLVIRRTRILGVLLVWSFHTTNHVLIFDDIGWFPLLGAATVTIFLDPDWPARLWRWIKRPRLARPDWGPLVAGALILGGIGALSGVLGPDGTTRLSRWFQQPQGDWPHWSVLLTILSMSAVGMAAGWKLAPTAERPRRAGTYKLSPLLLAVICCWLVFHVTWPLRHYAIPGDVNWTEEGGRFAWRMKATAKHNWWPQFRVIDPEFFTTDANGHSDVAWDRWPGPKLAYHQVNSADVDFSKLPALMVVLEPLYGERILLNPWSGRPEEPLGVAAAKEQARRLWRKIYGREPKLTHTVPLAMVLDEAQRLLAVRNAPEALIAHARAAKELAVQISDRSVSGVRRDALLTRLNAELIALAEDKTHAEAFRTLLGTRTHPFSTSGAYDQPVNFIQIEDPFVIKPGNYVTTDREAWKNAWPQAHYIYVDIRLFSTFDWKLLPKVVVFQPTAGDPVMLWNPHKELVPHQMQILLGYPDLIHQYANHIADVWTVEYGRRPRVYSYSRGQLPPMEVQVLIDPTVDLAAVRRNLFTPNDWIMPLKPHGSSAKAAASTSAESVPKGT